MDENEKREKREKWQEKWRWGLVAFVVIAASILFLFLLLRYEGFAQFWKKLMKAGQPIIIGLVIAYLLNPIVNTWDELFYKGLSHRMKSEVSARHIAKGLSIFVSIALFVIAIGLLIWAIVPSVITSIASLVDTVPKQYELFLDSIENGHFENSVIVQTINQYMETITEYVQNYVQTNLIPQAQTYIAAVTSGVISFARAIFNFIIGIIAAVYVLSIKDTLKGQSKKIIYAVFRPKYANVILTTARKSSDIFGGFISGKIVDSIIVGIICYVGCLIIRVPQPLLIAVIIGVTNIIPVFGPFIGAIPSLFLVVIVSPIHALYLLIFIVVLQQVDGNIIGPKILGDSTGLSTFWVMFAILVGGGLWGFMGMLLGVPVFGVIYYIIKQLVAFGVKKRQLPVDTCDYIDSDLVDLETNTLTYLDPAKIELEKKHRKEALKEEQRKKRERLKKLKPGSHQDSPENSADDSSGDSADDSSKDK